ncbi:MAG TPA: hypothetical protein VHN38_10975, partial [Immundisolibacter sp.]|nr:hypothetical protein [Immundisolibacter sp.]
MNSLDMSTPKSRAGGTDLACRQGFIYAESIRPQRRSPGRAGPRRPPPGGLRRLCTIRKPASDRDMIEIAPRI